MTGTAPNRRARAVFIGTGPFGVEALQALAAGGASGTVDLVGVVTSPGKPSGRMAEVRPSPIETAARQAGVAAVLLLARLRPPESIAAVLAMRPDLIVLADDGRIVPPALLDLPLGALNLHPSLLPRHRGATPIASTILAGDLETGVTLIRMDDGIDTGPIVAVERVTLTGREKTPELEGRLAALAAGLLVRTLPSWIGGDLVASPQPATGATLTRLLRREDGRLNPLRPAIELERQVRAFQPWPGSHLETPAGRIVVHEAAVAPALPGDRPGTLAAHGAGLALVTADGRLEILEAQPAGGRRMSAAELRRGRPGLVGAEAG